MTNEELYQQYLSGDTEAFEQLYLQMQGFIASVAKDAAQNFVSVFPPGRMTRLVGN